MDTLPNPQPENLIVVTSLLTLAFHRHLSAKEGVTGKKRLELISNVSTTDTDANNHGDTNNDQRITRGVRGQQNAHRSTSQKYKELFNAEAPLTASRRQLIPKITYQIQVLAFGGINSSTQRMIDDLNQGKMPVYAQRKNRITLPAGTLIVKEYRGETYKIKVTDEDFILNGIHYSSLAKIARFITGGTNWNVQRFFKLSETVQ